MNADLRIADRWYAPLVRPVLPAVDAALKELEPPDDPWTIPRTGLGGAVVIHVARGFGMRKWRRTGRAAVVALEGYNQRVHVGEPKPAERARWLERDIDFARRMWESMLAEDDPILRRVMDRLLGARADVCDSTIPEAVLFLRAAVAAGVMIGDVPDPVHAALDRHATWLGLSWEAHRGTLCEESWRGALSAVALRAPYPSDPDPAARSEAVHALSGLPNVPVVRLFEDVLRRAPNERSEPVRNPRQWQPLLAPSPRTRARSRAAAQDAFSVFQDEWQEPIECALEQIAMSGSQTLGRAASYLLGQGGKRIRPLIVLASARACGGSARRALPIAAAVEWLHQGSLVLDDIIDEASLRRGAPPLHAATSPAFATGVAAFLFARVLRAVSGMHPDIRTQLVRAAATLALGERLELRRTGDSTLSKTAYYKIIEAKTARIFSCAAAVGALSAEAPSGHVRALSRYGREIGLAFQIVDDVLDYLGDPEALGKRPGTDLRAAKMTLPLIALRERLHGEAAARLCASLGNDAEFPWVLDALRHTNVGEHCRERAQLHVARALSALEALAPGEGRDVLRSIAEALAERRC